MENKKNFLTFILIFFLLLSCAKNIPDDNIEINFTNSIVSGESVEIEYKTQNIYDKVKVELISNEGLIENYGNQAFDNSFFIRRIANKDLRINQNYFLKFYFLSENLNEQRILPLDIEPSVIVESLCGSSECQTLTGNVIQGIDNTLRVKTYKIQAEKFVYQVITPYNNYTLENEYNSPVLTDWIEKIKFDNIPENISFYIAKINIKAVDQDNNFAETSIPVKVVRPLEIKHFGKHELAEVYEPVPVTGCIPGSVGNNVQYSESTSETRQQNVSITYSKNWSDSYSNNLTSTSGEGINISETQSTVNTSSLSNSETQSESFTDTNSQSESNNISYNTSDGENWSWTLGESNSFTEGQTQSEGSSTGINGSTTVGVSGEGSLPFLAKASGKVEVSAGVSRGWNSSNTNSSSETSSENRGYSTGGSSQSGRTFGSVQNDSRSHSLSGSYVLSSSTSNSISESSGLSSGRVWNMSESISNGQVVTEGNSESIAQTIVTSNSSSTTFSYSGYIPRGRYGIFFRQTSRYVKLSEIITYDLNGFPQHAGYIMMNTWAWAPELSISNSCENAMTSNLPEAECLIQPCGE